MTEKTKTIPPEGRQKDGRFAPGNPGKKKGNVSIGKRKIAQAARELFERYAPKHFEDLFKPAKKPSTQLLKVRQDALEFLANRGWGRAPMTVHVGKSIDPNSPEGILLALAGQPIPGGGGSDNDDDEEDADVDRP